MSSDDPKAEQSALATLRTLRQGLDVKSFTDEDRTAIAEQWVSVDMPKDPATLPLGDSLTAAVFPLFGSGNLNPRLVPCTLALRTFAAAIEEGLPGAEHEAEQFLRDCGFEDEVVQRILTKMVSRAPTPDPGSVS